MQPRVTVIIPTYNWSTVLRYSIQCVLDQTYSNFELLVIGDGCTDNSAEVVESFKDPRVHWINLPKNSGSQAAPNNCGLAQARGELIAYLGHDDLWLPSHLELLVKKIASSGADIAYTLALLIHPQNERLISGILVGEAFGETDFVVPSSVVHRIGLVREIGGWKDHREIPSGTDSEFFQRALRAGKKFVGIDRLTVFKFTSAKRKNSYKIRSCEEQELWYSRIKCEPDIETTELAATIGNFIRYGPKQVCIAPGVNNLPPGWAATQMRQLRGLEEVRQMPALSNELSDDSIQLSFANTDRPEISESPNKTLLIQIFAENHTPETLHSEGGAPFYLSYHWLTENGVTVVHDGARSVLFPALKPGDCRLYGLTVNTPPIPGRYQLRLAGVQEGVRWFNPTGQAGSAFFIITPTL